MNYLKFIYAYLIYEFLIFGNKITVTDSFRQRFSDKLGDI